jgi:hypothetical protein
VPGVRVAAPGDLMVAMFTCGVCDTRLARTISRSSYERGTVLVRCPGCRGVHVLADHLGFVDDEHLTAEALLEAKGERVRRGAIGLGGDVDEHALSLTAQDVAVLRSAGKAVGADGAQLPVVPLQGVLGSVERVQAGQGQGGGTQGSKMK